MITTKLGMVVGAPCYRYTHVHMGLSCHKGLRSYLCPCGLLLVIADCFASQVWESCQTARKDVELFAFEAGCRILAFGHFWTLWRGTSAPRFNFRINVPPSRHGPLFGSSCLNKKCPSTFPIKISQAASPSFLASNFPAA